MRRWRSHLAAFHLRDLWWRVLDRLEGSRAWRLALYITVAAVAAGATLWFWVYPGWSKRNAIKIARDWLASGHLRYAAEAAQQAAALAPESPEPWQIAAELARRGGQMDKALEYARRAAELAPTDPVYTIGWAAQALQADQPQEAERVLNRLPAPNEAGSAHAQRLRGEIARRQLRFSEAQARFEAAARLDGPLAIDEVPLGLILLNAADQAERSRGLAVLTKWSTDREWGPTALRTLLADASARNDKPAMLRWAEALRAHPSRTVTDMSACLLAIARSDEARLVGILATLERDHAATPQAAAQLLGWLNEIGRPADAIEWFKTLPADAMQRPPLCALAAEALRAAARWAELRTWVDGKDWGADADFLRWTYALQADRMLKDEGAAQEQWRSLYGHAQLHGAHALFAAANLYSWGQTKEAEALWWRVAEQTGQPAIEAAGALARHYQVSRDAEGQYRVFRRLYSLRNQDAAVGNNYAFFATLTGRDQTIAHRIARANLDAQPANPVYMATFAFTLIEQSRAAEALTLLKPRAGEAASSPALAFVYGLALAGTGNLAEARILLHSLPPDSLTAREVELVRAALKD